MTQVLSQLPIPKHSRLLVDASSGDDAAVWQISDTKAIVVTTDFITPIVDDAYTWGQIATTNAVSDIYAMGADPLFALNIVGWNTKELQPSILVDLLKGAQDKADESGFLIAGGHSIEDAEPKYGMCVIGEVNPLRILKNNTLRNGDVLILTKPLGLGILTTAIKSEAISKEIEMIAISTMLQLNKAAKNIAIAFGASAATDVTGFGLLGHLLKMIQLNKQNAELYTLEIPIIEGAYHYAMNGNIPSGSRRNLEWVLPNISQNGLEEIDLLLLADAQTSGGLLFGIREDLVDDALAQLRIQNVQASAIGQIKSGHGQIILNKSKRHL